jgi:hypothetical protein
VEELVQMMKRHAAKPACPKPKAVKTKLVPDSCYIAKRALLKK